MPANDLGLVSKHELNAIAAVTRLLPQAVAQAAVPAAGLAAVMAAAWLLLALSTAPAPAQPRQEAGNVEFVEGRVVVRHRGATADARTGTVVMRGDRIETGRDARLSIVLADGTRVQVGSSSAITVSQVVDSGARKRAFASAAASMLGAGVTAAVLLDLHHGVMRLAPVDAIAAVARDKRVEVRTSSGTVRCTSADIVLAKRTDALSLVVLSGRAQVRNSAGMVDVDRARHGIDQIRALQPPGRPFGWNRARIRQVLAEIGG